MDVTLRVLSVSPVLAFQVRNYEARRVECIIAQQGQAPMRDGSSFVSGQQQATLVSTVGRRSY